MKRTIFALALCAACGDDADAPSLQGLWYFSSATRACDYGVLFDGDEYETNIVCRLESGAVGVESEAGAFSSTDTQITTTPKLSSCSDARGGTSTMAYDFIGKQLRIVTPTNVLVLDRVEPGEATQGSYAYGCYDSEGVFTPMPVEPIQATAD